jgi:hypothetical protein
VAAHLRDIDDRRNELSGNLSLNQELPSPPRSRHADQYTEPLAPEPSTSGPRSPALVLPPDSLARNHQVDRLLDCKLPVF